MAAIVVVPALLVLLAPHLERFSIYRSGAGGGGMSALSRRLTRRPVVAALLVGGLLLVGSVQAFAVDSSPPSPGLLPPENEGRRMYEAVDRVLGPGWGGGIEVLVDGRDRPVTTPKRLRRLARFERAMRRDRGVATVAGLTRIEESTADLRRVPGDLSGLDRTLAEGRDGLAALDGAAVARERRRRGMRAGLRAAASGADLLNGGTGQTAIGGRLLAVRLRAAATGSRALLDGMRAARTGAVNLGAGSATALAGSTRLADGLATARGEAPQLAEGARELEQGLRDGRTQLARLREPVGVAEEELANAWDALQRMSVGKADPEFLATLTAVGRARGAVTGRDPLTGLRLDPEYDGLDSALAQAVEETGTAADGAARLADGADRLVAGLGEFEEGAASLRSGIAAIADGNRRLAVALGDLAGGGEQLAPAVEFLASETDRLAGGLAEVDAGSGLLARELRSGGERTGLLTAGLARILDAVGSQRRRLPNGGVDISRINRRSPGFFRSGYFYLSSVGRRPARRAAAGGARRERRPRRARGAAGDHPHGRPGDRVEPRDARAGVERQAEALERDTGARVLVGGDSPTLQDFNDEMREAVPKATVALALVTLLVLIPVLRSLLVPLAAVVLNVLTVGATFGVMALLFNDSLLGGPGYMDTFTLGIIITVIFGLAIDYEVFVLARVREEYLRTGSSTEAIERGIAGSARVVTGAAVIMIAVFIAFSTSGFISMRNVGVALAVAVFIDAFLIRMLALPGIMRLLGDRAWWLPRWLDRALPEVRLEPPPRAASGATGPSF